METDKMTNSIAPLEEVPNILLKRKGLKEIYNVACLDWKQRLSKLGERTPLENTVPLSEEEVISMYDAANGSQIEVLNKWLTYPKKEGTKNRVNAMPGNLIDRGRVAEKFAEGLSIALFSDSEAIQILGAATPKSHPELRGRALYLGFDYTIELGEADCGGTFMAFYKKEE